jgi:hypothetical protein
MVVDAPSTTNRSKRGASTRAVFTTEFALLLHVGVLALHLALLLLRVELMIPMDKNISSHLPIESFSAVSAAHV